MTDSAPGPRSPSRVALLSPAGQASRRSSAQDRAARRSRLFFCKPAKQPAASSKPRKAVATACSRSRPSQAGQGAAAVFSPRAREPAKPPAASPRQRSQPPALAATLRKPGKAPQRSSLREPAKQPAARSKQQAATTRRRRNYSLSRLRERAGVRAASMPRLAEHRHCAPGRPPPPHRGHNRSTRRPFRQPSPTGRRLGRSAPGRAVPPRAAPAVRSIPFHSVPARFTRAEPMRG